MANLSNINNKFLVTTGGNVGIGVTGPTAKLDIGGNTAGSLQAIFGRGNSDSNFTVRYTNGITGTNDTVQGTIGLDYANGYWADMAAVKFIRDSTAGELAFYTSATATSGVERMRIDSSGNVGIGVTPESWGTGGNTEAIQISTMTSLSEAFDGTQLASNFYFDGTNDKYIQSDFATSYLQIDGSHRWRYAASGTANANITWSEAMRIDTSGNVGINDTIGYGKLAIKTSGTFTTDSNDLDFSGVNIVMKTTNTATNAVGSGIVWLKGAHDTRKVAAITNYTYGDTDQSGLNFYVQQTSSGSSATLSEAMRINNSGNVGIGETNPTKKIDVYQSSTNFGAADFRHVNGNRILINPSYNYYDAYNHIFRGLNGTDTHLTINNLGNVGIGTTSPQRLLHLRSTNEATGIFLERSANYGFVQYNQVVGSVETYHLGFVNNNTFSSDILVANESGNVGIGTDSPQTKLEVNGGLVKIVENSNTAFYGGDYVRVFGTQSYGFRNSAGSAIAQISLTGNSYFNGGNVGIGITSPSQKLQVDGGAFGFNQGYQQQVAQHKMGC